MKRFFLLCGIFSSVLYVGTDIIGGLLFEGYDFTSQYISELGAIGATSRSVVVPLYLIHNFLVTAYAIGVGTTDRHDHSLRAISTILMLYVIVGVIGVLFFPMSPRGVTPSFTDTMHQVIAAMTVVFIFMMLITAYRNKRFERWFRLYSIGTLSIFFVLGIVPFLFAVNVDIGEPTPWVGLVERIMTYGYMLWASVFAISLIRRVRQLDLNEANADAIEENFIKSTPEEQES